ncbi:MAG: DUF6599 family protein [Syntrophobacteraceae bacterium]
MRAAGRTETCIGIFILLLLAGIAGGVYTVQSRFDPEFYRAALLKDEKTPFRKALPSPDSEAIPAFLPEGLSPMGPEEIFDRETLSEKINGKAELYLSSGFVTLTARRFSRKSEPKSWLELYVYEMGEPGNAFSVYSMQKRQDARSLELGTSAYRTEDALFFTNGPKYIEIISASNDLEAEMLTLARNIVGAEPQQAAQGIEFSLFPPELLDQTSISLHMSDVFGFDKLDRIYMARYGSGEAQMTAFLSKRDTSGTAGELAAAYGQFLVENGGEDLGEAPGIPGSKVYQVFDTFEVVLHKESFLAGVHEAEARQGAEELALRIYNNLRE